MVSVCDCNFLQIGNTAAYEDIDGQRRSERNYKFAWYDELLDKTSEDTQSLKDALEMEGTGGAGEAKPPTSTHPPDDSTSQGNKE